MKITYEFEPDSEKNNDAYELTLHQNVNKMHDALIKLDDLRRALYKGWKYTDEKTEATNKDEKYSWIDVDSLLDDICEILNNANIDEMY